MKFEDKISEIQKRMLSLALEFSGEGVTAVYIYGARERNVLSFDAFFKVDLYIGCVSIKDEGPLGYSKDNRDKQAM